MYLLMIALSLLNFIDSGHVKINDAWVRPGGKDMNTALYFKVINGSDTADSLLSVTSSIADIVQIHETYMKGEMMGMRMIAGIAIGPHSTVECKPGGYHVMVIGLKKDLRKNDTAEFTLHFKNAGDITAKATVQ